MNGAIGAEKQNSNIIGYGLGASKVPNSNKIKDELNYLMYVNILHSHNIENTSFKSEKKNIKEVKYIGDNTQGYNSIFTNKAVNPSVNRNNSYNWKTNNPTKYYNTHP